MSEINDGFGDETEYIESAEEVQLSEQDKRDLAALGAEAEPEEYHTILEVWRTILVSADRPDNRHVTPRWASEIVSNYLGVGFPDMPRYVDYYFSLTNRMLEVLDGIIAADEDCLKPDNREDDLAHNRDRYLEVLREWQLLLLTEELEWDVAHPDAPLQLAALAEVQKMFFGQTGVVGYLEAIKLEVTEEDQEALATTLATRRDELMGAK